MTLSKIAHDVGDYATLTSKVCFLTKPFRDQELLDRINTALKQAAENREELERHTDLRRRSESLTLVDPLQGLIDPRKLDRSSGADGLQRLIVLDLHGRFSVARGERIILSRQVVVVPARSHSQRRSP